MTVLARSFFVFITFFLFTKFGASHRRGCPQAGKGLLRVSYLIKGSAHNAVGHPVQRREVAQVDNLACTQTRQGLHSSHFGTAALLSPGRPEGPIGTAQPGWALHCLWWALHSEEWVLKNLQWAMHSQGGTAQKGGGPLTAVVEQVAVDVDEPRLAAALHEELGREVLHGAHAGAVHGVQQARRGGLQCKEAQLTAATDHGPRTTDPSASEPAAF